MYNYPVLECLVAFAIVFSIGYLVADSNSPWRAWYRRTRLHAHDPVVLTLPYRVRRPSSLCANHGYCHRRRRWCHPGSLQCDHRHQGQQ